MHRIAIFASGSGTNAQRFFDHFANHQQLEIALLLCNNPSAKVLDRAKKSGIETFIFSKEELKNSSLVLDLLIEKNIDFIVLAGFMVLIPEEIIQAFPKAIVNIHPALLPKYGGKGMYGDFVHKAVIEAADKFSGITIHYVNSRYDEGDVIFQTECPVYSTDTPESLASRIHQLEHIHYPLVVERMLLSN